MTLQKALAALDYKVNSHHGVLSIYVPYGELYYTLFNLGKIYQEFKFDFIFEIAQDIDRFRGSMIRFPEVEYNNNDISRNA